MNLRIMQTVIGLTCTVVFLTLALYSVPLGQVGSAIAGADPVWIGAALLAYAANLALRTWRWKVILEPLTTISYRDLAKGLLVGYGLNTIMPARLGEIFRVEFLKRNHGLARVWVLSSVVIERVFDGLAVVGLLGIGLLFSAAWVRPGEILIKLLVISSVLFATLLLAAICLSDAAFIRLFARVPWLSSHLRMVQRGLAIVRTRRIVAVAFLTLIVYVPDTLTLWLVVKAVGVALGPFDTMVLTGAASLSTLLPSGPAFAGTMQFAYALAIEFAGGSRITGIAAATLAQLCILLPTAVIGTAIFARNSGSALFALLLNRKVET